MVSVLTESNMEQYGGIYKFYNSLLPSRYLDIFYNGWKDGYSYLFLH
jgi:hypothetical protein